MVGWVGVLVDGGEGANEGEVWFEVELGGLAAVIGGWDRRVRSLGAGSGDFGGLNYRMDGRVQVQLKRFRRGLHGMECLGEE